MDEAGIDESVVVNFAWQDADLCRQTNDYILESAAASDGRLLPFCIVRPGRRRRANGGRALRPGSAPSASASCARQTRATTSTASPEADLLAWAAKTHGLTLLFHVSEPVGHAYPGKERPSRSTPLSLHREAPDVTVVAAHWGGGLPFYGLMRQGAKRRWPPPTSTRPRRLFLYRPERLSPRRRYPRRRAYSFRQRLPVPVPEALSAGDAEGAPERRREAPYPGR